jgi:hypothetical protein
MYPLRLIEQINKAACRGRCAQQEFARRDDGGVCLMGGVSQLKVVASWRRARHQNLHSDKLVLTPHRNRTAGCCI